MHLAKVALMLQTRLIHHFFEAAKVVKNCWMLKYFCSKLIFSIC